MSDKLEQPFDSIEEEKQKTPEKKRISWRVTVIALSVTFIVMAAGLAVYSYYLITKLQEKYPNALLICITPWKINTDSDRNDLGKNTYDYAKAMVEVCEYRGVVCFNAADTELSQVYMEDAEFRSKYCIAGGDISHLNITGFEYVMPKFEKFIAAEYEEFLNAKQSN